MLSWGRTRDQVQVQVQVQVQRVRDLDGGPDLLAFIRSDGNVSVIHGGGRQKFLKWKQKFRALSCSDQQVALLTEGGAVVCVDVTHAPLTPRLLRGFRDVIVSQVSCGSRHSLALTRDGQLFSWGQDSRGQLGLGGSESGSGSGCDFPQPVRSLSAIPLLRIAAGGEQSFAVSASGAVYAWGRNDVGQLGLGDGADRTAPTAVRSLDGKRTTEVGCGLEHAAALTEDGAVFTFGGGRHGQLGHNSLRDEPRPRLVAELWGSKVVAVACGSHHTLALTRRSLYSFGRGGEGQLGRLAASDPSVPLPVPLPPGVDVRRIFAAGNCSFAATDDEEVVGEAAGVGGGGDAVRWRLDDVMDKWSAECDSKTRKKIQKETARKFSSASCWNGSFLEPSGSRRFRTPPRCHGLNLPAARQAFKKLLRTEHAQTEVEAAVLKMLGSLDPAPLGAEPLRLFLLLAELLHAWRRPDARLPEAFAAAVVGLSEESREVLGDWWAGLTRSALTRQVAVWTHALSAALSSTPVPRNAGVRNLLVVLNLLFQANSRAPPNRKLPECHFCLPTTQGFLREELRLWALQRQGLGSEEPLVLCRYPFIMDPPSKSFVFHLNAQLTQELAKASLWAHPFSPRSPDDLYLFLELNRDAVLEDTFKQLAVYSVVDYRRPLGVWFNQNCQWDPGYQIYLKDFFYKVFHEAVSPESGMFMFNDSETLAWFSSKAPEDPQRFFYFGVLCGLALYNNYIVYLPFPLVLFKKLLDQEPDLQDMLEFSPVVGGGLRSVLQEDDPDILDDLCLDFCVNWDGRDVDLDPDESGKPVTSENKRRFVDAYLDHAFNASVDTAFREFRCGFFQVCERQLVELFTPEQLQEALVGGAFEEWEVLRQRTDYEAGYHENHPNIQMFWEVFEDLAESEKKNFLWFVTGFERIPSLNLDRMRMRITLKEVPAQHRDQYYPEAHTCSSLLFLPLYSSRAAMKDKLREALDNSGRIYR
ncbi:unnamed protein product [Ophioblennius macclurei]